MKKMCRFKIARVIAMALLTSALLTFFSPIGEGTANAAGERIYWESNIGVSCPAYSNNIGSANLDGSNIDSVTISNSTPSCGSDYVYQITSDANYLYWGLPSSKRIARASLDGSNKNLNFISGIPYGGYGIAVDANYVYFENSIEYGGKSDHSIGRANLDGTGVNNNFINLGTGTAPNLQVAEGYLYWSTGSGKTVKRIKSDGTGSILTVATFANFTFGFSINTNNIFYSDFVGNKIYKSNIDGSELSLLLTLSDVAYGFAATDNYIYWNSDASKIGRAKLDNLSVNENFISGISSYRGLAVRFSRGTLAPRNDSGQDQAAIDAAARAAREAQLQQSRQTLSELLVRGESPTINQLNAVEYFGSTEKNISLINSEIAKLPLAEKNDLSKIYKIVMKYALVDTVASHGFFSFSQLVDFGITPELDSVKRSVVMRDLKNLQNNQLNTVEKINQAIQNSLSSYQARKDRLAKVRARNASRYPK